MVYIIEKEETGLIGPIGPQFNNIFPRIYCFVLGVGNYATLSHQTEFLSYYGYDSTVDCNNLLCGTRVVYSSNPNTPVNNGTHGLLLALAGEGDYILQIAAIYNGDIRVRAKITGTWYGWKTIYTH